MARGHCTRSARMLRLSDDYTRTLKSKDAKIENRTFEKFWDEILQNKPKLPNCHRKHKEKKHINCIEKVQFLQKFPTLNTELNLKKFKTKNLKLSFLS